MSTVWLDTLWKMFKFLMPIHVIKVPWALWSVRMKKKLEGIFIFIKVVKEARNKFSKSLNLNYVRWITPNWKLMKTTTLNKQTKRKEEKTNKTKIEMLFLTRFIKFYLFFKRKANLNRLLRKYFRNMNIILNGPLKDFISISWS